jgi:hypothetical protein
VRCCRYWRNFNLRRMIQLTEENVKALVEFANELPTKYGLPLLQFIEKLKENGANDHSESADV